jgi:hypothetical protein
MRGSDGYNESLFSTVKLEDFVPVNHPLRPIRTWMNESLAKMDERFSAMYEADVKGGRPSIAPEKLMRSDAAAGALQRAQRATASSAALSGKGLRGILRALKERPWRRV